MKTSTPAEFNQWLTRGTGGVKLANTPAMAVVRGWTAGPLDHWLLVLASHRKGSGKSLAAAWAIERLYELADLSAEDSRRVGPWKRRGNVYTWVTCAAMAGLEALKPWERAAEVEKLRTAWLLVLDDMGTEPKPEQLQGILEHRYSERLLTIVTTNLVGEDGKPSSDWWERYDGRLRSRMAAPGDRDEGRLTCWHHCTGPDMRGMVEPELLPEPSPKPTVEIDYDALAEPLLASVAPRTDDDAIATIEESRGLAEAVKRSIRAGQVLDILEGRAEDGDDYALELLARGAAGGTR